MMSCVIGPGQGHRADLPGELSAMVALKLNNLSVL